MIAADRLLPADLSRACLRGADLSRADLRRAGLDGADLKRARLDGTQGLTPPQTGAAA
jgi:uncharacterized protein YjbI with pentapeptide repeats